MFPARTPRPLQPFGGSRSGTGTAVHTAPSIRHCRVSLVTKENLCRSLAEQKRVRELLTQSRELLKQMQAG